MTRHTNLLAELSQAIAARVADARNCVAAIRVSESRHLTATNWGEGVLVASEQSLPRDKSFDVVGADGARRAATVVGDERPNPATGAQPGQFVLAIGAGAASATRARLGILNYIGPEWHSRRGGRIEQRLLVDIRLSHSEEGGPVLDADGATLGISTFGPRGQVLVIPSATLARIVPRLLEHGRIARGWLGVTLQPVAIPDALRAQAAQSSGLMVMSAADNGPAAKAGILAGDILLRVNGSSTQRLHDLGRQFGPDSIGKSVEIALIRAGALVSVQAVISERPPE